MVDWFLRHAKLTEVILYIEVRESCALCNYTDIFGVFLGFLFSFVCFCVYFLCFVLRYVKFLRNVFFFFSIITFDRIGWKWRLHWLYFCAGPLHTISLMSTLTWSGNTSLAPVYESNGTTSSFTWNHLSMCTWN